MPAWYHTRFLSAPSITSKFQNRYELIYSKVPTFFYLEHYTPGVALSSLLAVCYVSVIENCYLWHVIKSGSSTRVQSLARLALPGSGGSKYGLIVCIEEDLKYLLLLP